MPAKTPRHTGAILCCTSLLLASGAAMAAQVDLVGGATDPYDSGYVPVPPSPPQDFSTDVIASLADGDTATGFSFQANAGDYSSNPLSTVGFQTRFDFDVSAYEVIDRIDFTWTGRYELGSPIFNDWGRVWLSAGDGQLVRVFTTGNDAGSDLLHSFTASFERLPDGFDDVDALLHHGLASLFVQTELGFTMGDPLLPYHLLDTRDVSANVIGTLRNGGPVGVPAPAALPLLLGALGMFGLQRRRCTHAA